MTAQDLTQLVERLTGIEDCLIALTGDPLARHLTASLCLAALLQDQPPARPEQLPGLMIATARAAVLAADCLLLAEQDQPSIPKTPH